MRSNKIEKLTGFDGIPCADDVWRGTRVVGTRSGADRIYYQSAHLAQQVNQALKAMKNDRLEVRRGQRQRSRLTTEWTKKDPKED